MEKQTTKKQSFVLSAPIMHTHRLHLIIYMVFTFLCSTALLPLVSSCENDIPYHIDQKEPLLIMNALLRTGEEADNYVFLHLSEAMEMGKLHEATLTLYVNGRLAEVLQPLTDQEASGLPDNYLPYIPDSIFQHIVLHKKFHLHTPLHPGDHIRLEATAENGTYHASAEVQAPQPATLQKVDTCAAYLRTHGGKELYRQYNITLQDRPNEKNYYRLEIDNDFLYRYCWREYQADQSYIHKDTLLLDRQSTLINREDVILTDGQPSNYDDEENGLFPTIKNYYNIFTDSRFSNSSATLKVYATYNGDYYLSNPGNHHYEQIYRTHTIAIRLLHLNESEYRYLKALNCLFGDYDEELMEPITLPTNVKGGLGFVSISTESKISMTFPEVALQTN